MSSVIITPKAQEGLERCREFLSDVSPGSEQKAFQVISVALKALERFPDAGKRDEVDQNLRELVIPFGGSGYVALYHYEEVSDQVFVLAFRHQKEMGY